MPIFLTNITLADFNTVYKVCLHIILKSGPAVAGVLGALHSRGVQTDGSLEVLGCFIVAGHCRAGKAAQL